MPDNILIVDDEYAFANSLKRILSGQEFLVDTAASGREAFACMEAQRYAAILLDLHLPDLNGLEIAERITRKDPDCAVIILTGQASVDSAIQAVRFGCYDYITKPCRPEQIVHALKRATENRRLKQELLASRKKYQRLAEASSEGIVVFSSDGIIETNRQFCDLFDIAEEEAVGLSLDTFFPGFLSPSSLSEVGQDNLQIGEIEAIRRNGTIFPAEIRVKRISEDGHSLWVATLRDLSRHKQEERTRVKLEEKLTYAMRMESIGLMAGSVAHDLNNILSSIVTFPELLLLEMPAHAKYRTDINKIKKAGQQAAAVVADLLTIARGSACKKEIRSLNDIISNYQDSLHYLHQTKSFPGKKMEFDLDPRLGSARISSVQVTKALLNLVQNAAESIENQGTVSIYTKKRTFAEPYKGYEAIPPGEYEVLGVSDTGGGIAAHHLVHIFEPFYSRKQLGNSGTGLGLTIIMHTMRDHSGFVDVRSDDRGTVFELYFPTCARGATFTDPSISLDSLLGKGEKVLVVDDQENQRFITSSILKRLGYRAYAVENGEQAIQHLKREPVDLLLLDMILEPGMNGYETFEKIRELVPNQRAVVTSGYHNHPDRERIRALGVSHYLPKPLSLTHLAQAIRQEISS